MRAILIEGERNEGPLNWLKNLWQTAKGNGKTVQLETSTSQPTQVVKAPEGPRVVATPQQ